MHTTANNLLRPTPLRQERFTWDRENNLLVAEHSDLGSPRFGQVYNDACDVGITIVSPSGREVPYHGSGEDMQEGEIMGWRFEPAFGISDRDTLPRVLIIND
jgi:hypothetical protein